ncbi:MAG: proton-conducting transporter membrane subunit [Firmicutes bacterium]|nr:proton-conducting transporter membrane subunit [Bacillota bacterium]
MRILGRRFPRVSAQLTLLFLGMAWLLAAALLIGGETTAHGPEMATSLIACNRVTLLVTVYVLSLSNLVHRFAWRYLEGESDPHRFLAHVSFATAAVVLFVLSGNLALLWGGWALGDWALLHLLAHPSPQFWRAAPSRRATRLMILGNLALGGAVAAAFLTDHTFSIAALVARTTASGFFFPLLAFLLVLALMVRSVQFPLHFWLVDTLDAPTPVSALMHAGLVNSGGLLVVKLAPLWNRIPGAFPVLFAIGLVTALFGHQAMAVAPAIKQRLVFSTVSQMGYMVMEAGLGLFPLVIWHLMAHGFYKATSFLHSGELTSPLPAHRHPGAGAWPIGIPALLLAILILVHKAHQAGQSPALWPFLLAFAVEALVAIRLSHSLPRRKGLLVASLGVWSAGYFLATREFSRVLAGVLPPAPSGLVGCDPLMLEVVLGLLLVGRLFSADARTPRLFSASAQRWRDALYRWLLHAGFGGFPNPSALMPRNQPLASNTLRSLQRE